MGIKDFGAVTIVSLLLLGAGGVAGARPDPGQ